MTNLNEHANLYATSPSILISIKLMTEIGNAVVNSESVSLVSFTFFF